MIKVSELVLNFLLNAAWQIVVVALIAWICECLLRNAAAGYRHALWVAALLLSMALPFWSLFGSAPEARKELRRQPVNALRVSDNSTSASEGTYSPLVTAAVKDSSPTYRLLTARRQPLETAPSLLIALALSYALFLLYRINRLWQLWRRTHLRGHYEREFRR